MQEALNHDIKIRLHKWKIDTAVFWVCICFLCCLSLNYAFLPVLEQSWPIYSVFLAQQPQRQSGKQSVSFNYKAAMNISDLLLSTLPIGVCWRRESWICSYLLLWLSAHSWYSRQNSAIQKTACWQTARSAYSKVELHAYGISTSARPYFRFCFFSLIKVTCKSS